MSQIICVGKDGRVWKKKKSLSMRYDVWMLELVDGACAPTCWEYAGKNKSHFDV